MKLDAFILFVATFGPACGQAVGLTDANPRDTTVPTDSASILDSETDRALDIPAVDGISVDALIGDTGAETGAVCPGESVLCASVCVDTWTDRTHCGACGVACDPGFTCCGGVCSFDCEPGRVRCCVHDLSVNRGCVDDRSDPTNCGQCGRRCPDGQSCRAGSCAP